LQREWWVVFGGACRYLGRRLGVRGGVAERLVRLVIRADEEISTPAVWL
jgi:hypothetical protein